MFIIVNQSRRKESAVQFLDNLSKLQSDVIAWCNKQNKRKDNYGLVDLYNIVKNAYVYAFMANDICQNQRAIR